ncbi:MAG: 3-hydroxyacyl-CoA dehydrogenase family protein [Myxococcales bacterium]|nr:3-hydroxyacyl-CoA dehydrogenase family protein [Myxococcales bacterium]
MADESFDIRRVVVVGAGTMGHGIAQVAAQAGFEVVLNDVSAAAVAKGLAQLRANLDGGVAKGKLTVEARDAALQRVQGEPDLRSAAALADLLIEAVPERLDLKRQVFGRAAETAPAMTIFATNTSSIPLRAMADALPRPERFVGLHFFNPVHIQSLLEVVQAAQTSAATVELALAFARRLGKTPIVVRDVAGFASSRLGLALGLEAMRMLEEGVASAADIDTAMKLGYRHPMGPLELTDLVGLDVRLGIAETLAREIDGVRFAPPQVLRDLVAAGRLGRKTGAGFYEYPDGAGRPA